MPHAAATVRPLSVHVGTTPPAESLATDIPFGREVPTFTAPHVSVVLPAYDEVYVHALVDILGPEHTNPHYLRTRR